MTLINEKPGSDSSVRFQSVRLSLANGWKGRVALSDSTGNCFKAEDWARCLSEPNNLIEGAEETIKVDGPTMVVRKSLKVSGRKISVVVKRQVIDSGLKRLAQSFFPAKAIRNFNLAARLCRYNIPTARPLAALEQKKGFLTLCSIYITEYASDSANLYYFIRDALSAFGPDELAVKKDLSFQIAEILASLHKVGLWHRDAKAGNFLVYPVNRPQARQNNRGYKVTLVDLDGIKPYLLGGRDSRFRGLYKLASTILCHRAVNLTDYLRTFTIYSNLTGLDVGRRGEVFRNLAAKASALRLLSMAKSAMDGATAE